MLRHDDERETAAHKIGGPRFEIDELDLPNARGDEEERETGWSQRAGKAAGAAGAERETKFFNKPAETIESVAWLYCQKGLRQGQLYQFKKLRTEFGCAADADLVVEDDYASGHHGAVLYDSGTWRVFDFASSNGTFVNGKRLGTDAQNPTELNDGDRVAVGESEFVFKRI